MSAKRARRCRTCGKPMLGHRQQNCVPQGVPAEGADEEQPETEAAQSLATPPVSPPAGNYFDFSSKGAGPSRNSTELAAMGLKAHWQNPACDWTTPITKPVLARHNSNDSSPSLVPTVLAGSDGHTIHGPGSNVGAPAGRAAERQSYGRGYAPSEIQSDAYADEDDIASLRLRLQRTKTPMAQMLDHAHALQLCDPVLSIMRVRAMDLPRMQATAGQAGLCTSIVRSPWHSPKLFKEEEVELSVNWQQHADVWLVVGSEPGLVQRTADMQQQFERFPGMLRDDIVVVQATYKHIFIASTVSALVILGGLTLLL